jgi:hypothetical protein
MQKIKILNVKWTLKNKNLQQSRNFFKKIIYIYGKFQCTSLINPSFDDYFILFLKFSDYFDIIF